MWLNLLGIDCNQFFPWSGLSKATAVKHSPSWSMAALSAREGETKHLQQPLGILLPIGHPKSKVSFQIPYPSTRLTQTSSEKCQNKTGLLETCQKHAHKNGEKKKNTSFTKDNKNSNNLIFIIIFVVVVFVIMAGHLILSSAFWMWKHMPTSK